jgi:hypothetical protein
MKKVKLLKACSVVCVLLMVVLVSGCEPRQSTLNELLSPTATNTQLAKQWLETYGDSPESVEHYNIAVNRMVIENIAQAVNKQGQYIATSSDPNSLVARIKVLEGEVSKLNIEINKMFANDVNEMGCQEFWDHVEKTVSNLIEKSQKTNELMQAKLEAIEKGMVTQTQADEIIDEVKSHIEYFEKATETIEKQPILKEKVQMKGITAEIDPNIGKIVCGSFTLSEPNTFTFEYTETNGIAVCPYCKKPTKRGGGGGMSTLAYFPSVYSEDGTSIGQDQNIHTRNYICYECGNKYAVTGNTHIGYSYIKE